MADIANVLFGGKSSGVAGAHVAYNTEGVKEPKRLKETTQPQGVFGFPDQRTNV